MVPHVVVTAATENPATSTCFPGPRTVRLPTGGQLVASGIRGQAAGVSPGWIYAYERTNGLLSLFNGSFLSEQDETEWDDMVEEYIELHDPDLEVDHVPAGLLRRSMTRSSSRARPGC
jgi:hypothetical protein